MTISGGSSWSYQCDGPGRSQDPTGVCRKRYSGWFARIASAVEHARAHGWDVALLHGQCFFFCPECRAIDGAGRYGFAAEEERSYGVVDSQTART